jgi:hypothetical protein
MNGTPDTLTIPKTAHDWLRQVRAAFVPGRSTPLLDQFAAELMETLPRMGHIVLAHPGDSPDVLLTTAIFGEPLSWRASLLLTGRRRLKLAHMPVVFTLVHVTPRRLRETLDHFQAALAKDPPNPQDFGFPGLTPQAYHTLYEQGRRGGPILSVIRLVQSQAMCIRNILVVGEDQPDHAYTFDLVGAHPRTDAADRKAFYQDLALRIVTAASTTEVTGHQVVSEPLTQAAWRALSTPQAMIRAGYELGKRAFFTEMVQVSNLVNAPAVQDAVSSQYSEGCYATWEPALAALITTITGSARPIDKDKLTDDELAIIVGIRPDGQGALVRHVEGKRNDPPSSEAVELLEMDHALPRQRLELERGAQAEVPVARSKLHGHRGVRSFDPARVEYVMLDAAYYHYPVSCSTEAQARAIRAAFSRSQALAQPDDPRHVVFTVLPGHGVVIVEKWTAGKAPFQSIWEAMDAGALQIDNLIPQGPFVYIPDEAGRMMITHPVFY